MKRKLISRLYPLQPMWILVLLAIVVGLCYYLGAYMRPAAPLQIKDIPEAAKVEQQLKNRFGKKAQLPSANKWNRITRNWRTVHQQLESVTLPSGASTMAQQSKQLKASWQLSWQSCMHGWRHRLWTEKDNERLVRDLAPWFKSTYSRLATLQERLVASRYLYMYVHGGVYADLDSRCLRSFEHLLTDCGVALSATAKADGNIAISFLFSKPGHQLWLRLLKLMHDIVWQRQAAPAGIVSVADPRLLARVVDRTLHSFKDGGPSTRVCVMPSAYFAPKVTYETDSAQPGCRPWLKMTDRDLTKCESVNMRSFVLHLPTVTEE